MNTTQMDNVQFIILAAGKGTRMNEGKESPIPKVLYQIANKPMISYILDTLKNLETKGQKDKRTEELKNIKTEKQRNERTEELRNRETEKQRNERTEELRNRETIKPIIVVGYKAEDVKKELGNEYIYAEQTERLGTGHAAKIGLESISVNPHVNGSRSASIRVEDVFIMQGDDSAFYTKEMLQDVIKRHQDENAVLSFLTTKIPHLDNYGKVLRDEKGEIVGVVEKENLTEEQKKLDEINCGAYLMDLAWAKANIPLIKQHHIGGTEYPLPDVIKMALAQKQKVLGIIIDQSQWVGVNSQDQLKYANSRMEELKN